MYPIVLGPTRPVGSGLLTWDVRDYARWEYGDERVASFLLAEARRIRRGSRRTLRGRLAAWVRTARSIPTASE